MVRPSLPLGAPSQRSHRKLCSVQASTAASLRTQERSQGPMGPRTAEGGLSRRSHNTEVTSTAHTLTAHLSLQTLAKWTDTGMKIF